MTVSNTSIQRELDTLPRHLTIQVNWNLTFSRTIHILICVKVGLSLWSMFQQL